MEGLVQAILYQPSQTLFAIKEILINNVLLYTTRAMSKNMSKTQCKHDHVYITVDTVVQ